MPLPFKRCPAAKPRAAEIGDAKDVFELLWLLLTTILAWVRPRHDLVLENLLLRHQLAVLTRPTRTPRRARLRAWDKVLWVLARRFCAAWREHLTFVTPDTVVRWHRQSWRLFWRWKARSRGGRPHLSPEFQELIRTMSRDNRLWGSERIRGELLKLDIGRQQPLRPTLSLAGTETSAEPDLAHLPGQSRVPFVGGRPVHGAHADLRDTVRPGVHCPRPARAGARQRDRQPDRHLGTARADRGDALGLQATPPAP